jgi:hypothetical protein
MPFKRNSPYAEVYILAERKGEAAAVPPVRNVVRNLHIKRIFVTQKQEIRLKIKIPRIQTRDNNSN